MATKATPKPKALERYIAVLDAEMESPGTLAKKVQAGEELTKEEAFLVQRAFAHLNKAPRGVLQEFLEEVGASIGIPKRETRNWFNSNHAELEQAPAKETKPKKRRPTKKAVKEAFTASLTGQMTEEHQAVLDASGPNRREIKGLNRLQRLAEIDPWERDRAWISDAMTQCPLPLVKPKGAEAAKIIREVRTGSGNLTVIYTATGLHSIPFGKDAYLLDILISEARKRGERLVSFETAIEIMRMAGFDIGGRDYRLFKEALERIGGLHISVIRRGVAKGNYRVVKVQNLDIPSQEDLQKELSGQKRMIQYAFEFSEEFYDDFMRYYSVVPQDFLDAFAGAPTEYAIARWLYRRVTKGQSSAFIPLEEVHREIAPSDTNHRRFRSKFEKVLMTMQAHWPDLRKALVPRKDRKKGAEVLVGVQLHGAVPSLIGDRKPQAIGKVGTDR